MSPVTDDMKARVERELAKQKRPADPAPDEEAIAAVAVGYLAQPTAPGFSFLDDLVERLVDVPTQLAATLVDCYLDGCRATFTRRAYRPQFRAAVDEALAQQICDASELARETLTDLSLGMWKDESDLRAKRAPTAMMFAIYYVLGID